MTDLASLVLAVDSTQVKTGTAALDGLTAAGTRAQAASVGLGVGVKGAAAEATALAAGAQATARASMDMASGFRASESAARVNTMAMRESLVVMRELSRGNFTRIPGSLSLLAQGVGAQGGVGAFASAMAQQLGLIKQVQNAELAEAAAAAASAAAGVEGAVRKAGANIMAADTEVALAEAQLRTAASAEAEAAAQARLAAANEAVGAAAAEAAIAENALAVAQGRATETGAASAAASRTIIGGTSIGLIGIATVAGIAYGAIKQFQDQVKDDGTLTAYRDSLGLTHAEMLKLTDGVDTAGGHIKRLGDVTVTFGDVMHGVWHELSREVSNPGPWNAMAVAAESAFDNILSAWNKVSAGISAGLMFIIDAGKAAINGTLFTKFDPMSDIKNRYADELKRNAAAFGGIKSGAIQSAEDRMREQADALKEDRSPKKGRRRHEGDHGLQEALDKLGAEIRGQYALAAAYGVSAAAAQRAAAQQKAAEDAISHKGNADQFYAKELQKAVAEDVAHQAKSNAGLNLELSIRSQLNGEVAAGTTSLASYADKLKLQTTLNALNADLENADIGHKQVIRDLIKQTIDLNTEDLQLKAQLNALTDEAANDNEIDRMRLENSLMGASNKERAVALAQLEAIQKLKQLDPNGLLSNRERNNYIQSNVNKAVAGVQSPFQQWAKDIPQTAAAITEALQTIEFKGFDGLASAITDVVTGTKSLGAAFKEIAASIIHDIVEMTIKMLIFRAISGMFGGSAPVGVGPITQAANGHAFIGGNVVPFANGGIFDSPTMFPMSGGRTGLMGEAGPEAVMPLTRDGQGRLGVRAANHNAPQEIIVHVSTDQNFHAEVAQVAGQVVVRAAPTIIKAASSNTMRTAQRMRLAG